MLRKTAHVFAMVCAVVGTCHAEDLTKHYKSTLVAAANLTGLEYTCDAKDAWQVESFRVEPHSDLSIQTGKSQVVFGKHKSNVLWAAVLPAEPGRITRASDGQGDQVTSIWLRFHPSRLSELFPPDTVIGRDEKPDLGQAKQIAEFKMRSSYHVGGRPSVVPPHHTIVDCETLQEKRRFYLIDSKTEAVQYVSAFETRIIPVSKSLTAGQAAAVFESAWSGFDRTYAMFTIKPGIDWPKLRDRYLPRASQATTARDVAGVINEMLQHLADLHVFVEVDGQRLPSFNRERPLNANIRAIEHVVGKLTHESKQISWAISEDRLGYILISGLSGNDLRETFLVSLSKMSSARGLILDLRLNGGGNELNGQSIASYFLDQERVYAKSKIRTGVKHTDLSRARERKFRPSKDNRFEKPVIVLQGQRTMSSAEALVLMLKQCPNVTTMGDRTAGSSGNPAGVNCGAGVFVNIPTWIPLDANGKTFDSIGIIPDRSISATPSDFREKSDPVLSAAMQHLQTQSTDANAAGINIRNKDTR